jgi:DNA helicase-2/ATP-dependent DNA helicase PcrA
MQLVKEWLLKELKRAVKRERSRSWVEEEIQFLEKENYMEAYKKLQEKNGFTGDTFDDFDREQRLLAEMVVKEKFKPLFKRVKNFKFIDLTENYLQLFTTREHTLIRLPDHWSQISKQTVEQIKQRVIPYEDATPIVYLQDLIEGRKSNTAIRHIFIDEAQDYTPFQFAFIQRLFPYSKMTLLGDFNQAIFSGATGSETVLTDFDSRSEKVETYVLNKTYRSTREIVEFTRALIDDGDKIEPFNRRGNKPTVKRVEKTKLNGEILKEIIKFKEEGHQTVAVICRTEAESKALFEDLKEDIALHLIEKGTVSYEKGINVIPSYLAKGIEFDAVILYDCSRYQQESERKLFYTVCTRAMHVLHLFTTSEISPLMSCVPKDYYIME